MAEAGSEGAPQGPCVDGGGGPGCSLLVKVQGPRALRPDPEPLSPAGESGCLPGSQGWAKGPGGPDRVGVSPQGAAGPLGIHGEDRVKD